MFYRDLAGKEKGEMKKGPMSYGFNGLAKLKHGLKL